MFKIKYKIISKQFDDIDNITEEEIQYDFLLGNLSLLTSSTEIKMDWEWIPLLDFAYCMQGIVNNLKGNDTAKEYFEFTENAETLEFLKLSEQLKITSSFSSMMMEIRFSDFEKGVYDFHFRLSEYVRNNISSEPSNILQKYLIVEM